MRKAICIMTIALSACAQTPKPVLVGNEQLCESWKHITIRKADRLTEHTAAQIEGNNNARPAWGCEPGENRAKARANG